MARLKTRHSCAVERTLQSPARHAAKGIYKPRWTDKALTVRKAIGSSYKEPGPCSRDDGSWWWLYHQEDPDATGTGLFTNRGLLNALRDRTPVGALRQHTSKPSATYRVLGLALVSAFQRGYFLLEGFDDSGDRHGHDLGIAEAFAHEKL